MSASPLRQHAQVLLAALCQGFVRALQHPEPDTFRPLLAHLALMSWNDNPIAQALAEQAPALAEERSCIPHRAYDRHEDDAPCIVTLPSEWLNTGTPSAQLCALLTEPLGQAWFHAVKRLRAQHLCGIAFSHTGAAGVAVHWADLARQHHPGTGQLLMLRHFDPRVMQRSWPLLRPAQQRVWMGRLRAFWSIEQPWGPWRPDVHFAHDSAATAMLFEPLRNAMRWHTIECFDEPAPALRVETDALERNHLLDAAQWHGCGISPMANSLWARLALNAVAPDRQPSGQAMSEILARGHALGLAGDDLEQFAALSWVCPADPASAVHPRDWDHPVQAQALRRALERLALERAAPPVEPPPGQPIAPPPSFAGAWLRSQHPETPPPVPAR